MCRDLGITEEQIFGLSNHRECSAFSELEQLALDYALALTQTPAEVPDELFEALRAELSEKQMIELTAVVAFENYLARFNRGFKIEALGFSEGATCPLPDHHPSLAG